VDAVALHARVAEEKAIHDALARLVRALERDRCPDLELAAVCRLTGLSLADAADEGERTRRLRITKRPR
jgi:hypothetical protein